MIDANANNSKTHNNILLNEMDEIVSSLSSLWSALKTAKNNPKAPAVACLGVLVLCSLLQLNLEPYSSSRMASVIEKEQGQRNLKRRSLGREIVERAFQETYKVLLDECSNVTETGLTKCMYKIHRRGTRRNRDNNPDDPAANRVFPWWFETLLRDGSDRGIGLQGPWHHNVFKSPTVGSVDFCNIEKTASSEWKILDCMLRNREGASCQGGWSPTPGTRPKAVFLRDPLERFLSGFIDKCVNVPKREKEAHCQPIEIFAPGEYEERRERLQKRDAPILVHELESNNRIFFDAYTDVIGLKWNVHFFPASLYCDGLFRTLHTEYDFVGHMGGDFNFHDNLRAFGEQYNILDSVEKVFNLQKQGSPLSSSSSHSSSSSNSGSVDAAHRRMMETRSRLNRTGSASKRIHEYYTPKTLRKVLEFMSIDYAHDGLNLPLPMWVDEMLEEEVQQGTSPRAVA